MAYQFVVGSHPPRLYEVEEFGAAGLVRRGLENPFGKELLYSSLGFGFVTLFFFLLRITNRLFILHRFGLDDFFMMLSMIGYGSLLVLINHSADYATNIYPASIAEPIIANPVDIANRIYGSKLVVGLEQAMLVTTWTVKICIWLFIRKNCRLTKAYEICVWFLLAYIAAGFIITEALYFFVFCRPFHMYWAIPVTNPQCTTHTNCSIVQAIFNISSYILLIAIPFKLIYGMRLPWNRKLLVSTPFCMGGFTVVAAALNTYFKLASPQTTQYQLWYIREVSVSLWLANTLRTWTLWKKLFRFQAFDATAMNLRRNSILLDSESANHQLSRRQRLERFFGLRKRAEGDHGATRVYFEDGTPNLLLVRGGRDDEQAAGSAGRRHARNNTNFTLMTLKRGGDDASHSIAYREQEGIV